MSYFVFDLDETLAEMYPMYYFIASLTLRDTIQETDKEGAKNIPESLNMALSNAYNCFLNEILTQETSIKPLGILRPGILSVMKQLAILQSKGKVKNVIIYSNNGHLQSLHFVRDLIHLYLKNDNLVKECIHWDHPMRQVERSLKEGTQNKTWQVLKTIMIQGNCQAPKNLEPKNVYFFDDLTHPNLQRALGDNYYKVPPYTYMASFEDISKIWLQCLFRAGIDDAHFAKLLIRFFATNEFSLVKNPSLDHILIMFDFNSDLPEMEQAPVTYDTDEGIQMMKQAILKCSAHCGGQRHPQYSAIKQKKRRKTVKKIENK